MLSYLSMTFNPIYAFVYAGILFGFNYLFKNYTLQKKVTSTVFILPDGTEWLLYGAVNNSIYLLIIYCN